MDNISRSVTLPSFISTGADIASAARTLLAALAVPANEVRGVGIVISKLHTAPESAAAAPRPLSPARAAAGVPFAGSATAGPSAHMAVPLHIFDGVCGSLHCASSQEVAPSRVVVCGPLLFNRCSFVSSARCAGPRGTFDPENPGRYAAFLAEMAKAAAAEPHTCTDLPPTSAAGAASTLPTMERAQALPPGCETNADVQVAVSPPGRPHTPPAVVAAAPQIFSPDRKSSVEHQAVVAMPAVETLDMAVLDQLPAALRIEVMQAYGLHAPAQASRPARSAAPVATSSGSKRRADATAEKGGATTAAVQKRRRPEVEQRRAGGQQALGNPRLDATASPERSQRTCILSAVGQVRSSSIAHASPWSPGGRESCPSSSRRPPTCVQLRTGHQANLAGSTGKARPAPPAGATWPSSSLEDASLCFAADQDAEHVASLFDGLIGDAVQAACSCSDRLEAAPPSPDAVPHLTALLRLQAAWHAHCLRRHQFFAPTHSCKLLRKMASRHRCECGMLLRHYVVELQMLCRAWHRLRLDLS